MNRTTQFKSCLTALFLLLGISTAWAQADYTLDTTLEENKGTNNSYAGNCDVTVGDVTWNVSGNSTMAPWRIGGKNLTDTDRTVYSTTPWPYEVKQIDLTVGTASSITVNSLTLLYSTNADFSDATAVPAEFAANSTIVFTAEDGKFPMNAYYKFVFNVTVSGGSNRFVQFSKVEFYNAEATGEEKGLKSIEVSGEAEDLWQGDVFTHKGIAVTATWDDATTSDVTAACTYSGYDMKAAGEQTVTVTYRDMTATYTVKVLTIANTQETAYTPAEAIALVDAGKGLNVPVYVKGTVSKIVTEYSSQYGNITFDVSVDGTEATEQFQFFRNIKADGEKWTDDDVLPEVGDEVIGCGLLTKYKDTYEFAANNYLVFFKKGEGGTGIRAVDGNAADGSAVYNLAGQRVSRTHKGVLIKNGRKMLFY